MPEPEYPETILTNWSKVRFLFARGFWLTKVVRLPASHSYARYEYTFRMSADELKNFNRAIHSSDGLQIDAHEYDEGERALLAYQAVARQKGEWVDQD